MPTDESLESEIVANIYRAATGAVAWESVAAGLASLTNSHQSILILGSGPGREKVVSFGIDAAIHDTYTQMTDKDVWLQGMYKLTAPSPCRSEQIVSLHDLEKTDFYNLLCKPADVAHMAGVVGENRTDRTVIFACQRSRRAGAYSNAESQRLARLSEHFVAGRILEDKLGMLNAHNCNFRAALNQSLFGITFCDTDRFVTWHNCTAERIFCRADGLTLRRGALHAVHPDDDKAMRQAIHCCAATALGHSTAAGTALAIRRRDCRRSYHIQVCPTCDRGRISDPPCAIVFISDPDRPVMLDANALARLFGLTNAEALVCSELAKSHCIHDVADTLSVQVCTVRTQLKSIFRKCDVTSQAELIHLFAKSLCEAPIRDDDLLADPSTHECDVNGVF